MTSWRRAANSSAVLDGSSGRCCFDGDVKWFGVGNGEVEFLKSDNVPRRILHEHNFIASFFADVLVAQGDVLTIAAPLGDVVWNALHDHTGHARHWTVRIYRRVRWLSLISFQPVSYSSHLTPSTPGAALRLSA